MNLPCCFAVQIMHKDGSIMNNSNLIFFDLPQDRVGYFNLFTNLNGHLFYSRFKYLFFFSYLMKLKFDAVWQILLEHGVCLKADQWMIVSLYTWSKRVINERICPNADCEFVHQFRFVEIIWIKVSQLHQQTEPLWSRLFQRWVVGLFMDA